MLFKSQEGKSGILESGVVDFPTDGPVTFIQDDKERLELLYEYRLKLILDVTDDTPKVSDEHVESMKRQIDRIEKEIMMILSGGQTLYIPLEGE